MDRRRNPDKTINTEMALLRINVWPAKLLTVDDAYYLLFGIPAHKSIMQRLCQVWEKTGGVVIEWGKYIYYELYSKCHDIFSNEANIVSIGVEDAPPGTKEGDILIPASELELFLRRSRTTIFHPLLGIEIITYDLDGEYRISPADLARHLKGEPVVEYETGATNLLDCGRSATTEQ